LAVEAQGQQQLLPALVVACLFLMPQLLRLLQAELLHWAVVVGVLLFKPPHPQEHQEVLEVVLVLQVVQHREPLVVQADKEMLVD